MRRLAVTLEHSAGDLAIATAALVADSEAFDHTIAGLAPRSPVPTPAAVRRRAEEAKALARELRCLALAFELADRRVGNTARAAVRMDGTVWVEEATLDRYRSDEHRRVLTRAISAVAAQLEALRAALAADGFGPRVGRDRQADLERLHWRVTQLRALAEPVWLRWAGSGEERWLSEADLWRDVATAHAVALALRPAPPGHAEVRRRPVDHAGALADFRRRHAFVDAALTNEVIITPRRLEILLELDGLAAMPLDDFLAERRSAETERPHLDWRSDGCSGPVPAAARPACLRHDFLYRNARLLRDQWGLPPSFARRVKDTADERLGAEVWAPYAWYEWTPGLVVWLGAVELAVEAMGSVDEPWHPPRAGAFFGDLPPS